MSDSGAMPRTRAALRQGREKGLHLGAQVYLSTPGGPVLDHAEGEVRPGQPMDVETPLPWMSAGKPITALAIAALDERGELSPGDPVQRYWPAFGQKGKGAISLAHLLAHTAGFHSVEDRLLRSESWPEAASAIETAPLEPDWTPGERAAYQAQGTWLALGEILQRVTGQPFEDAVRDLVLSPWGLEEIRFSVDGQETGGVGELFEAGVEGIRPAQAAPGPGRWSRVWPGSSAGGPARLLGRLYDRVRDVLAGVDDAVISADTVRRYRARQRVGLRDETFGCPLDWGYGFLPDNKHLGRGLVPYGYGPHCSPDTFGHGGVQSSVGFLDPGHGLAGAVVCNGMPGEPRHQRRIHAILQALYEDLHLTPGDPS